MTADPKPTVPQSTLPEPVAPGVLSVTSDLPSVSGAQASSPGGQDSIASGRAFGTVPTSQTAPSAAAAAGFASVAKQITAWTNRGLVSAIILVAGLAFGRQVLQWWAEARQGATSSANAGLAVGSLGDPLQEHLLQFGTTPWCLARRPLVADDKEVLRLLRNRCAELMASTVAPEDVPGPAEAALLERLASQTPAQQGPGSCRVYELVGAFPMVVGIRPATASPPHPPNQRVVSPGYRVVTWAIAVPTGPKAWTAYMFFAVPTQGGDSRVFPELPIPQESERTLFIHATDGGCVACFRGRAGLDAWRGWYESWFSEQGWRAQGGWSAQGATWSIRLTHPKQPNALFDVLLAPNEEGQTTGLVLRTCLPVSPEGNAP